MIGRAKFFVAVSSLAVATSLAFATDASAGAYEGFDYTLGAQLSGLNGGTGWNSAWDTNNGSAASGTILAGLGYTDAHGNTLSTSGGAFATDANTFFYQATRDTQDSFGAAGTSVWMSFLVQQASHTDNVNYAMATLGERYGFGDEAMLGGINGSHPAVVKFYTNTGANAPSVTLNTGDVTFMVLRFDFSSSGNDTLSLWSNPLLDAGSLGAPDITVSNADYASSFTGLTLVQGDFRTFTYDEIRIGDSFSAVAPAVPVPEPEAYAMMVVGLGLMGARLRRRKS